MRTRLLSVLLLAACSGPDFGGLADAGTGDTQAPADAGVALRYPSGIDPVDAAELRTLVFQAAADSTLRPLICTYSATTSVGTVIKQSGLPFTLTVEAVSSGGPAQEDARRDYSVLFETSARLVNPDDSTRPIDPSSSMLVLFIQSVTPSLAVIDTAYDYSFHGYYTDRLVVRAAAVGAGVKSLDFIKTDKQGAILMLLECEPTAPLR